MAIEKPCDAGGSLGNVVFAPKGGDRNSQPKRRGGGGKGRRKGTTGQSRITNCGHAYHYQASGVSERMDQFLHSVRFQIHIRL